jgi:hypothetical protein
VKRQCTIFHSRVGPLWNPQKVYGFYKKCVGTRYTELVFFHVEGSTGHVLHSGASGA